VASPRAARIGQSVVGGSAQQDRDIALSPEKAVDSLMLAPGDLQPVRGAGIAEVVARECAASRCSRPSEVGFVTQEYLLTLAAA
jgi:hypothetical protein